MHSFYLLTLVFLWAMPFWPRSMWRLADLFAIAPLWVLFIPLVPLLFMAIVRRDPRAFLISTVSTAIVLVGIMGFNMPWPSMPTDRNGAFFLKVISVNLGHVHDLDPFRKMLARENPDLVLIQEFSPATADQLSSQFKAGGWDLVAVANMGFASRFRVLFARINDRPPFGGFSGKAIVYGIQTPVGQVHVLNVHLETLREGVEAVLNRDKAALGEMQRVTDLQEEQTIVAMNMIAKLKPLVIGGDLNMPVLSPVYQAYWSRYRNAFNENGLGFGYTKHLRWHGVRIDHILHDLNWRTMDARVGPDIGGDHHPVIAQLMLK